jgi:hypothetical protein
VRQCPGKKEIEGCVACGQVREREPVNRLVELGVEVVDPEFVEVAEDDVRRAVGDEVQPVVEGLLVVFGKLRGARFHFDEAAAGPDEVGEFRAVAGKTDSVFESAAFGQGVGVVSESFEQVEEKRLSLAFLVAFEFGAVLGAGEQGFFE